MPINKEILSNYQNPGGTLNDRFGSRTNVRIELMKDKKDIMQDVKGLTVLDIGCNNGYFVREAIKRGAKRAVGVDKTDCIKGAIKLAEKENVNAEFWQVDVESKEFKRHCPKFDVVFLFSVLTHLKDPEGFLDWLDDRIRYKLFFESNHGEIHKNQIEMVKKHIHFAKITYLGMSEVPEHPHHLWLCRKSREYIKYPILKDIPTEFIAVDKILNMTEETAMSQKITYPLDSEKFKKLKADIKKRGIRDPIILREDIYGKLIGFQGVHRYLAAVQLNYKYVPCKVIR